MTRFAQKTIHDMRAGLSTWRVIATFALPSFAFGALLPLVARMG
jgi:hypothetical protein